MFQKILDVKRFVIISPEILVGLSVFLLFKNFPEFFESIASSINERSDLPSYIGAIPFLLVIASYQVGMKILRPGKNEENKVFYEWPLYWAVEARVYSSIIICIICCISAVLFYINPMNLNSPQLGALLIGSISISVVTVSILVLAKLTLQKIFTLHG